MANGIETLLDAGGFVPHGVCLLWQPEILALHVSSDMLIGLSYYSIPVTLLYFVHRRRDVAFGWLALLFAVFILACGTTHFFSVWTLWNADYVTEGVIKAITAIASLLTAATLWLLMPRLLALPSPRQMAEANAALQREVEIRRLAELRYAGFFNNMTEALFIVSVEPEGRFVFDALNPAHVRLTGLDPDQVCGRPVEEALEPDVARAVLARYLECCALDRTLDYEETHELPVGRRIYHTVLVPVHDPEGRIIQILGSSRDVTERKRFQEDMIQTSKLVTLGTLAAGLAHEMSQPLNVIRMWADNLLTRLRDGQVDVRRIDHVLTLIGDQTERVGKLIDNVRTFGRHDGGGARQFRPGDSVRHAVALVANQFAAEDIAVTVEADSDSAVQGRPLYLEQLVLNLLSNARDAIVERRSTGHEAGRIDVTMREDVSRGTVTISVIDDGGGIDPAIMPHIFDPFFTTKDVGKGTGLGLSVGYGIVETMHGRIEASNLEYGSGRRGARFTVTLPVQSRYTYDQELAHA